MGSYVGDLNSSQIMDDDRGQNFKPCSHPAVKINKIAIKVNCTLIKKCSESDRSEGYIILSQRQTRL